MAAEKVTRKLEKGILVAIEGIDGSGKTTEAKLLRDFLKQEGYPVTLFLEPTKGKWGGFYFSREEDAKNKLKPVLDDKKIVIMDRFYMSSVAYQGALGLNPDLIEKESKAIAPMPDLTIILDLPPRVALSRIENNRTSKLSAFEGYLGKVRKIYIKRYSGRLDVKIIDASSPPNAILTQILNALRPIIAKHEED